MMMNCNQKENQLVVDVFETSESGNKLTKVSNFTSTENASIIKLDTSKDLSNHYWVWRGFYGVFSLFTKSIK